MQTRNLVQHLAAALLFSAASGCAFDEPGANPKVFGDAFSAAEPQRFGDALGPIAIDPNEKVEGFASLRVTVPDDGCANSDATHFCYAGWAIVSNAPRDLSGYDSLTFRAKSNTPTARITQIGFGNDNSGGSKYTATANGLSINSTWTKYAIPIPLASRLTKEKGLFFFAAGNVAGAGFTFWLDDVKFETLGSPALGPPRVALATQSVTRKVGTQLTATTPTVTFAVNGTDQKISPMPAYFTWASSNPAVATVNGGGVISTLSFGTTTVTAKLGDVAASGELDLIVPGGSTLPGPFVVFDDNFTSGAFQAFDTALGTIAVDTTVQHSGTASIKLNVPGANCPGFGPNHYCYTGGAVVANTGQDLSLYNALSFWAKASVASARFDVFGVANDNSGTSQYTASLGPLPITTDWVQYLVPLPLPAKLGNEKGLFWFATNGPAVGYNIWLDDMRYEALSASVLGPARPAISSGSVSVAVGATFNAPAKDQNGNRSGLKVPFAVNGKDVTVNVFENYLTWTSSNAAVASLGVDGLGTALGAGTTTITAKLGDIDATGAISVTVR